MFCPNCGHGDTYYPAVYPLITRPNVYRCFFCGHTFTYIKRPKLEKEYGPPLIYTMENACTTATN